MRLAAVVLGMGVLLGTSAAHARGPFVYQIPNGTKATCLNCHTEPAGDSPRNAFGMLVEQRMGGGSTLDWPSLAKVDSDGDGFTNGQELGDPCGTWVQGQSDPAIPTAGNPGEAASKPTGAPDNNCADTSSSSGDSGGGKAAGCAQAQSTPWLLFVGALLLRRRSR